MISRTCVMYVKSIFFLKRWKCEKIAEQMNKIKPTINEKLAFIKSKKRWRLQINKCERILPKMCFHQENLFVLETNVRNEICMVEVSIGSYKEETNLKDGKVSNKKNLNEHLLWKALLILLMKNVLIKNVEIINGIFSTFITKCKIVSNKKTNQEFPENFQKNPFQNFT